VISSGKPGSGKPSRVEHHNVTLYGWGMGNAGGEFEEQEDMGTDWGLWGDHWVRLFDAGRWKQAYEELLQEGYHPDRVVDLLEDAMRRGGRNAKCCNDFLCAVV
jgi:hypothetical protein